MFSTFTTILALVLICFGVVDILHGHYDRATLDLVIVVVMKQSWEKP